MECSASAFDKKHCIVISPRQKGNPLIRHFKNVSYVEGETQYDYKVTEDIQVLFLSLRYHRMHRSYIGARLKQLRAHRVKNPFIICQVDVPAAHEFIAELTVLTFTLGYRLLMSWSARESACILEILKLDGHKGLELLNKKQEKTHLQAVQDIITCVRNVNSTDASTICRRVDTAYQLLHISAEELEKIHGLGKRKIKSMLSAFNDDFF